MMLTDQATPGEWLVGGGELGELIRSTDWSKTALGPRDGWPQSLRTAVCLVVESKLPTTLLWGPELLLLYNDAYRVILADKHPAALGRSSREVWAEAWHINEPMFAAVMERGETLYFEDRRFPINRRGSLEDAYFTLSYSPVRVEDGSIAGTLVILQETTARVLSGEALRKMQGILLEGQRIAHVGSFEYVADTRTTVWSEEEYRIYGLDPAGPSPSYEDMLARCIHPDDAAQLHETFSAALQSATVYELTHRIVRPDGTVRWVHDRAQPYFDRSGKLLRYVGATLDITEAKQAEEALRESEERYRLIVENAEEGIWAVDAQARTTFANTRMAVMLGYPAAEMMGRSLFDFMDESWRAVASRLFEECRAGVQNRHEFVFRRKDGTALMTELGASPLVGADGSFQGALALVSDNTQRKRVEEERDRAMLDAALHRGRMEAMVEGDQRKTEFLALLAHELRNPLAPIRNSLYILERAVPGGELARRAQAIIERQVGHLTRLVDDLLDVSRITRGKAALQRERLELCELVSRTAEDYRGAFVAGGIELEVVTAPREVWVNGDRTRLAQVVGNLLQNATKFTPGGGKTTVTVEADATRGQATVRVRDTGRGIAPEVLPRLFEPFTQADITLDRQRGGLGLGLSLVKGLVEMHGGSAHAASDGPGQGATFTITLPLDDSAPGAKVQSAAQARAPSRRVLIIEDNRDAATSLREVLELDGHQMEVAFSGREGIAKARSFGPEVVLCDIGLPEMDGYEVARTLRADPQLAGATLVALTGYAGPEDVAKAKEAGFDAHLAKPPSMESLQNVLREGRA